MTEPFKRADNLEWTDRDHEFETLLRTGKLLYGHELSSPQQESYDRITRRLGEIVIERDEMGFR